MDIISYWARKNRKAFSLEFHRNCWNAFWQKIDREPPPPFLIIRLFCQPNYSPSQTCMKGTDLQELLKFVGKNCGEKMVINKYVYIIMYI
jgi:hypothetical protein